MRCSVIVPVYNGEDTIGRCLDGLAEQTIAPDSYEIVVVDDGSTDSTSDVVNQWRSAHLMPVCTFVQQENAGPAAARNAGAGVATAPVLLFTDADCIPERNWVEQMLTAFDDVDVTGAKGAYLSDQTDWVPQFVQAEYEDRYDHMRDADTIDFIDTYSAGYRRLEFLENGGFDAIFPTASVEDQEFSFRLAAKGYRLVFVPDARVRHIHDESMCDYARRKYSIGYWKALVTRRYPERLVRDSHTPQVLKLQIVLVAAMMPLVLLSLAAVWLSRLRFAWGLLTVTVVSFVAALAPFEIKLARRSRMLLLGGPLLLFVRALALGSGYAVGTVRFATGKKVINGYENERK